MEADSLGGGKSERGFVCCRDVRVLDTSKLKSQKCVRGCFFVELRVSGGRVEGDLCGAGRAESV